MKTIWIVSMIVLNSIFAGADAKAKSESQVVNMTVTSKGYEPNSIDVPAGKKLTLKIKRTTDETCATEILIPAKNIKADLPLNKEVIVEVGALDKGDVEFSCGMKMIKGTVHVK